jgi:hypothetical protein
MKQDCQKNVNLHTGLQQIKQNPTKFDSVGKPLDMQKLKTKYDPSCKSANRRIDLRWSELAF